MSTTPATTAAPNPALIFETLNAYQHTAALKGAIELEVFTHIGDGAVTTAEIAKRSSASERGTRILCDYLTIMGFLTKSGSTYGLTPDSALFLSKRSPAYMGTIMNFLSLKEIAGNFDDVAALVRKGGTIAGKSVDPESAMWVEFAKSMVPIVHMAAMSMAQILASPGTPLKVLDIAAGHGMFGISIAKANPAAAIVALDWKNVLAVAQENAQKLGVADRWSSIAGSAFDVDLGSGYDLVLVTNFLHHFDKPTNTALLKKIHAALKPGGRVATLEFVPNEDRVTPPTQASFAMMMLGSTPAGDAYTFADLDVMFRAAGFGESSIQDLAPAPQRLVITKK
jgi:2-polyprenyl-3-methyl-5-hydroxy-6-metoxy-1,4-benzoquinol methylase